MEIVSPDTFILLQLINFQDGSMFGLISNTFIQAEYVAAVTTVELGIYTDDNFDN